MPSASSIKWKPLFVTILSEIRDCKMQINKNKTSLTVTEVEKNLNFTLTEPSRFFFYMSWRQINFQGPNENIEKKNVQKIRYNLDWYIILKSKMLSSFTNVTVTLDLIAMWLQCFVINKEWILCLPFLPNKLYVAIFGRISIDYHCKENLLWE